MDKHSFVKYIYDDFLSLYIESYIKREQVLKKLVTKLSTEDSRLIEEYKSILLKYDEETILRFLTNKIPNTKTPKLKQLKDEVESLLSSPEIDILKIISLQVDIIISDIIDLYTQYIILDLRVPNKKKVIGSFKNQDVYKAPLKQLVKNWIKQKSQKLKDKIYSNYKTNNDLFVSISDIDQKMFSRSYANLRILTRAAYVSAESYTHDRVYKLNVDNMDFIYTSILEAKNPSSICTKNNNKLLHSELNGTYPQLHANCVAEGSMVSFTEEPQTYFKSAEPELVIKILFDGGELITTPNHEIMTDDGWKLAKDVTTEDKLLEVENVKSIDVKTLFEDQKYHFYIENDQISSNYKKILDIVIDKQYSIVYNYSTISNFFICNGIVVHNCNSTVIPTFKLPNKKFFNPESKTLKKWFDSLPKEQKIKIIGKRNYKKSETNNYNFPEDYFKVLL